MESRTQHFQIGAASPEHLGAVADLRASADMHLALMRHLNSIGFSDKGEQHREMMSFKAKQAGAMKHDYNATRTGEFEAAVDVHRGVAKIRPNLGKQAFN